jgi:glycosyltransferase involved in cell wall biosynthesis
MTKQEGGGPGATETGKRIPDLAVIIPARNEASGLGGCLSSVRQALEFAELTDAEVIVVDDDSTDETSDVARAYGALALRQSPRLGPLGAWSLGVANSSASFLFFVDADSRVDEEAFSALLRGFARPTVGVIAARGEPDSGRTVKSLVERSASFSALLLHETKSRLVNHDFLPIGRLMAVRRSAWQEGDHRLPCDRVVASRAKQAGWEIIYAPEAVVYYRPLGTYDELRSDYVRTQVAQPILASGWSEPLPRGVVGRAAAASLRRQPLSAAAWLALRVRLWSERSRGLIRPDEVYARWDRLPDGSPRPSGLGHSYQTPDEQTEIRA